MDFDLILKGGRIVDPASGRDGQADIGFADGRVAAIDADLPAERARATVDAAGAIVTPGLIDLHTHVYWGGTSLGVDAERLAERSGTTTFVDAGSAGAGNFLGFRAHVIERADIRILADGPLMEKGEHGDRLAGMEGTLSIEGKEYTVPVKGAVGRPQLLAPTAAIAVGLCMGMKAKDALAGAAGYEPPAGRGRLLAGKRDSLILDDSYNASPAAVREALASLQIAHNVMPGSRRIAALGDMLELGRYSREEHERIGEEAAKKCDVLVTVGARSREAAEAAKEAGMAEDAVHAFDTSHEAASFLRDFIQPRDIILIKGSQSMRMERIGEAILQNPADQKYLVRQDREWKRR